jgi:hypothetical protein
VLAIWESNGCARAAVTDLCLLCPLLDVAALDDAIRVEAAVLVHRDLCVDLQTALRTSMTRLALGPRYDHGIARLRKCRCSHGFELSGCRGGTKESRRRCQGGLLLRVGGRRVIVVILDRSHRARGEVGAYPPPRGISRVELIVEVGRCATVSRGRWLPGRSKRAMVED